MHYNNIATFCTVLELFLQTIMRREHISTQ